MTRSEPVARASSLRVRKTQTGVTVLRDSSMQSRFTGLNQLAFPIRFDVTVKKAETEHGGNGDQDVANGEEERTDGEEERKNGEEMAEMERRRKGKQVEANDGEEERTGGEDEITEMERRSTVVVGRVGELGEASIAAAISGEQRIDIPRLSGQNVEVPPKHTDAIYKEGLLSAPNIVALVVIFLATVGYSTGLNPPGGVNDDGEAVVGAKTTFSVFMLAIYTMVPVSLVTIGLLCGITPRNQRVQRNTLRFCHTVMWIGLVAFGVAFVSGSWLIVPTHKFLLKSAGLIHTVCGLVVLISYIWFKKARKVLRHLTFCDLDGSSDEDEAPTPIVTQ